MSIKIVLVMSHVDKVQIQGEYARGIDIGELDNVVLSLKPGDYACIDRQTNYDVTTGILEILDVQVGDECYSVKMQKREDGSLFDVIDTVLINR